MVECTRRGSKWRSEENTNNASPPLQFHLIMLSPLQECFISYGRCYQIHQPRYRVDSVSVKGRDEILRGSGDRIGWGDQNGLCEGTAVIDGTSWQNFPEQMAVFQHGLKQDNRGWLVHNVWVRIPVRMKVRDWNILPQLSCVLHGDVTNHPFSQETTLPIYIPVPQNTSLSHFPAPAFRDHRLDWFALL